MTDHEPLRVLFCFGGTQHVYDADDVELTRMMETLTGAFADLGGRFGINVLGTMDDDELMVGSSETWPWTCYILADVPDLETVTRVCNIVREAEVGGHRLWRYLKVEARVGRRLFFGNE